jgi:hypothetical protein
MLQGMRSALREIIAKIGSKSELFRVWFRAATGNHNNHDYPVYWLKNMHFRILLTSGSIVFTELIKRGPIPFNFHTLSSIPDI